MSYSIDWHSGASTQIEILSPMEDRYHIKYTSPFRSTIRPPVEALNVGPGMLDTISESCSQLEASLGIATSRHMGTAPSRPAQTDAAAHKLSNQEQLQIATEIGENLYTLMLPPDVRADLRTYGLHLEIGLDENLLEYPWELLNDGNDFLCLQHYFARFVNSATPLKAPPRQRPSARQHFDPLRILLVSVPQPKARSEERKFANLPAAEAETEAIRNLLSNKDGIEFVELLNNRATFTEVTEVLKHHEFHVIHFNGHARFNPKSPFKSALMLDDRDMPTSWIQSFISKSAPVLCFINSCETAATSYGVYSLARSFLETGAYLIGSRWKINDESAKLFAETFYESLIFKCKPIGEAVTDARRQIKDKNDLAWASYVYYGDPRVAFKHVSVKSE